MKITKQKLKQIIKEELQLNEITPDREWVDVYVARIQNHLNDKNTEGRGALMQMVIRLANAAKGVK